MLAKTLRIVLLIELLIYGALGARLGALSLPASVVVAIVGVLLVRWLLTLATFTLAWRAAGASPPVRLGLWRRVRQVVFEWLAFVANFVLISPFERAWMGADRLAPASGQRLRPNVPILLVHGYCCSRAAWWWLRRYLEDRGWTVATLTLEPIYADIEDYVPLLKRRVDEVLQATGAQQLILVGHSMGGLLIRAWLHRGGADAQARVRQVVTLATPYGGSALARLAHGANGRQMRPGNDWLRGLAAAPVAVDTVTIFSPHDNYVMPPAHLELADARRHTLAGVGHLTLLYSPRVAALLQSELERACPAPGAP